MTPRFVRTPDGRFEGLTDFPFSPHYLEWNGLQLHYLDEGPKEAPVALLLHGEPTWSYLYRHMIPLLRNLGFRCVAPDYVGFGRSDKVVDDEWYVIERHCESIRHLIEALDLGRISLFVQDWGGPIGLRQAVDMPERFDRLVIMNTWLHHDAYVYSEMTRMWQAVATNPLWLTWVKGEFPCGPMMAMGVPEPASGVVDIERAYEAPFTAGGESRAGPRRFPALIPIEEEGPGNARDQARCFEALKAWTKPVHFIWGEADLSFTADWGRAWAAAIPGASYDGIPHAGHFPQEHAPSEVVACFARRAGLSPQS